MKQIITLLLLAFGFSISLQAQNKVVMSKMTATWCINCGTWGWGFMEGVKDEFQQRDDALVLGVHFSGNLQNDVSVWWKDNLNIVGQPQFYLNNEKVSVGSSSWNNKLSEIPGDIDNIQANASVDDLSFVNAFINADDKIETNLLIGPASGPSDNDQYFNVYIYENNVEEVQSGHSGTVLHPNVLRASMLNDFEGTLLGAAGSMPNPTPSNFNASYPLDDSWDPENLGLLAIWWEKIDDTYVIKQSTAIDNIGLLSSSETTFDKNLFSAINTETSINISTESDEDFNYALSNVQGQTIAQGTLNREASISTTEMTSGMYLLNISKGNKYFTQKLFVK